MLPVALLSYKDVRWRSGVVVYDLRRDKVYLDFFLIIIFLEMVYFTAVLLPLLDLQHRSTIPMFV